jgi:hypothetical protein
MGLAAALLTRSKAPAKARRGADQVARRAPRTEGLAQAADLLAHLVELALQVSGLK